MNGNEPANLSWSEQAAGALGLMLLLSVLGFLGYKEVTTQYTPADVTVHVETIESSSSGYLVQIAANNHGEQSAAGVRIRGVLQDGEATVETAHITFQYVPPGSERKGGLYFSHDPRSLTLSVRAEGYERP